MLARKNCLRLKSVVGAESFIRFSIANVREEVGRRDRRLSRRNAQDDSKTKAPHRSNLTSCLVCSAFKIGLWNTTDE